MRNAAMMLIAVLGCCLPSFAGLEPGDWVNDVTAAVSTPHYPWVERLRNGPVKVMFITVAGGALDYQRPVIGGRMPVEWAQRMPLAYQAVTAQLGLSVEKKLPRLSFDFFHPVGYRQISPDEKQAELLHKLDAGPYELYVLNYLGFDALGAEAQLRILRAVNDGAGLLMIGDPRTLPTVQNGMFHNPDQELAQALVRADNLWGSEPIKKLKGTLADQKRKIWEQNGLPLRTYRLGKGRIVQASRSYEPANSYIFYLPEWTRKFQKHASQEQARIRYYNAAPIPLWWGEFEGLNGSFLRLLAYTAGRLPEVELSCPALEQNPVLAAGQTTLLFTLVNPKNRTGTLFCRIRSDDNIEVFSSKTAFGGDAAEVKIPALPGGVYYLDLVSRIDGNADDLGVLRFQVESEQKAEIKVADNRVTDDKAIVFTLTLAKPVLGAVARVALADSPLDRVWTRAEFPLQEKLEQELTLNRWYLPNMAGTLRVEVVVNGVVTARTRTTLFRPQGNRLPEWMDLTWGDTTTPLNSLINQGRQGWLGGPKAVNGVWGTSIQNYMAAGMLCSPWTPLANWVVQNNSLKRSVGYALDPKTKQTAPDWGGAEGGALTYGATAEEAARINALSPDMQHRPDAVRAVLQVWDRSVRAFDYGVQLYSLGDETSPGYDTFTGAFADKEFRVFLQRKFGSIEKLNQAWGRQYAAFDEILLLTTSEACRQKKLPEGAAQRMFAEENYYDVYRTIGSELRKHSTSVLFGQISGVSLDELNYDVLNASFAHPAAEMIQLRRTLASGSLYAPLYGYEIRRSAYTNKRFWEAVIAGNARGGMYFAANLYPEGGTLCTDLRDKMPHLTAARQLLANAGPLLRSLRSSSADMAILLSPSSAQAKFLAPELSTYSGQTSGVLLEYGKMRGIVIDCLLPEALEKRLPDYKVLVLAGTCALSDADARRIVAFARKGGMVVADVNPAVFNEWLGTRAVNPLAELFGDLQPQPVSAVNEWEGRKVPGVAGITPLQEKDVGKGRALLLNCTLNGLSEAYQDQAEFDTFLDGMLRKLGLKAELSVQGLPRGSVLRRFAGDEYSVIAVANDGLAAAGMDGGEIRIGLPKKQYIYRMDCGLFLAESDTATIKLSPPFAFLSCFERKQEPPVLKLVQDIAEPGTALLLETTVLLPGRYYRLQLLDKQHNPVRPRNEAVTCELIPPAAHDRPFPVRISYSDPKGDYTLRLLDVATGLFTDKSVTLK